MVIISDIDLTDYISIILYPLFKEEYILGIIENSNIDEIEDII